jgi:hypothetical protein
MTVSITDWNDPSGYTQAGMVYYHSLGFSSQCPAFFECVAAWVMLDLANIDFTNQFVAVNGSHLWLDSTGLVEWAPLTSVSYNTYVYTGYTYLEIMTGGLPFFTGWTYVPGLYDQDTLLISGPDSFHVPWGTSGAQSFTSASWVTFTLQQPPLAQHSPVRSDIHSLSADIVYAISVYNVYSKASSPDAQNSAALWFSVAAADSKAAAAQPSCSSMANAVQGNAGQPWYLSVPFSYSIVATADSYYNDWPCV